jgi:hypothetical protein
MSQILEVTVADKTLYFEVDDGQSFSYERTDSEKKGLSRLPDAFDKVIDTIDSMSKELVSKIKKFDRDIAPDEFEIQFGVKISAEAGAVVAKTAGESQISVKMTYKHKKETSDA